MIQGVVLFAAFVVIIANLLIEIAYEALDPRVGRAEGVTASYQHPLCRSHRAAS
jgi:hypothetical protein